jgi:hypothetical protein
MKETIQDGIGDRRLTEGLVPQSNRELAGHDGGAALYAIFDDFEEIASLLIREGLQSKIVNGQ